MAGAEFEQFDHLPRAFGSATAEVQRLHNWSKDAGHRPRLPHCAAESSPQCARLLAQHVKIMLQIEYLLLSAVAAIMPRNALASMTQLNGSGMNSGFNLGAGGNGTE